MDQLILENFWLVLGASVTYSVLSELIGMSKLKSNSIIELVLNVAKYIIDKSKK